MDILCELLILVIHCDTVPYTCAAVFIGKFIEDTIASQNNKVMVLSYFERLNIWFAYYNIRVASAKFKFGFRISESS